MEMHGTGTAGAVVKYPISQDTPTAQSSVRDRRIEVAGILDEVDVLLGNVINVREKAERTHKELQDYDLSDRATIKARLGAAELLGELSESRGLGWSDIAHALSVSVSAIRKWRGGGVILPENRLKLGRLASVLDFMEESAIVADPAGFLLMPIRDDVTIRYLDLFRDGRDDLILDVAMQRKSATEMLDEYNSNWKALFESSFEVVVRPSGERSVQRRS